MGTSSRGSLSNYIFGRILAIWLITFSVLSTGSTLASASPSAVNGLVGSGTGGSCTQAAFDTALASGGVILFDCGPVPTVISLTTTKTISQDTTVDGANLVTLSGAGAVPGIPLLVVNSGVSLHLQNLTLRDGDAGSGEGGALLNHGSAFLSNVNLLSNKAAKGGAIYNEGELILNGVTASSNIAATRGGALYNAIATGATVVQSQMTNVTISGNTAPLGGGGIYNDQAALALYNATVAGNTADGGGASIYNAGNAASAGTVSVLNTILGPNLNSPTNCLGPITSAGFNISSDASCALSNAVSDLNSTNPLIDTLKNNGGATNTRTLNPSSPAIDKGDNSHCPAVDQRGQPRPYGLGCDIGAVELQQPYVVPSGPWYVTNAGSDSNTCASVGDPCKTINAAIAKSKPGDTVFVAVGFYTGLMGDEVVKISHDLTLSGGWDSAFTTQNGMSVIQGKITTTNPPMGQRGLTVLSGVSASMSNFILMGGAGVASSQSSNHVDQSGTMGGGLFVDGKLVARKLEVTGNYADYGAGVEVTPKGELDLYGSTIDDNFVSYHGGGINALGGGLIVVGSTISDNGFIGPCPDCSFQGSQIDLDFGHMLMAFSTVFSQIDNSSGVIAIRNNGANIGMLSNLLDSPNACEQAFFNTSFGYNLENHNTCGFTTSTDKHDVDPLLGPLQNNGGLTPTEALPFYSPAVDMGYQCASIGTDQRGVARPQGPSCDAGAYENNSYRVSVTSSALSLSFPLGEGTGGGSSGHGLYNGIIGVLLPAGSASAGAVFDYTPRDAPIQSLPNGLQSAASFDLGAFSGFAAGLQPSIAPISLPGLNHPMTVSLSYSGLPTGISPASLVVMWYDLSAGRWTDLPSVVNATAQTVTFQTTHLGAFSLVGGTRLVYLPITLR